MKQNWEMLTSRGAQSSYIHSSKTDFLTQTKKNLLKLAKERAEMGWPEEQEKEKETNTEQICMQMMRSLAARLRGLSTEQKAKEKGI